jgi:hypothetical protein
VPHPRFMMPSSRLAVRLWALLLLCGLAACQTTTPPDPLPIDAQASLRIGINPTGADDPALFQPLEAEDELAIEFGFQGLWMVVLAFQTDALEGRITVVARIRTETDTILGEFGLAKQELVSGDDGYAYYLNLYLVVEGIEAVGQRAWVELEVEDARGVSIQETLEVTLIHSDNDPDPQSSDATTTPEDVSPSEGDVGPQAAD